MGLYYATLVSTYIGALLSKMAEKKRYKLLSALWIVMIAAVLIIFSGTRIGIGDTGMYKHTYLRLLDNPKIEEGSGDIGFTLLNLFLIQFSSNPQTLVFVVALITQLCNVYILHKYRSDMELEIFMYITAGYLTVTMNGMRQCLAAALLFLCTPFILKGDFKKYLLCVIIVSTLHQSALFMIPVYFIVRMKPWTKKFYTMIGIACLGIIFYDVISPYIFKALENTQYGYYSNFNEGGSSVLRTLVNMVPVILAYLKRKELKERWAESDIFINIASLNCIFIAFGMSNWIFNRFSLYLQLYNFILLPFIIKNCFSGKERRLLYFLFIGCYLYFFYREQVINLHLNYKSVVNLDKILYYYLE